MANVTMPDGVVVRFPDDMPREQIRDMILTKFPDAGGQVSPPSQANPLNLPIPGTPFNPETRQPEQPDAWERSVLLPTEKNRQTGQVRPAVPQLMQGMWDAATLPGDVFTGKVTDLDPANPVNQISDETLNRATNLAALASPTTPPARVPILPAQTRAQQTAVTRLQRAVGDDQIPLNQVQSRIDDLGPSANIMDLGANLQQRGQGIATVPGPGQQILTNAVERRAANVGARVTDDVAGAFGTGQNTTAMIDEIINIQRQVSAPLYDAVRPIQIQATNEIRFVMQTPLGQRAFRDATRKAANDGFSSEQLTIGLIDYAKQSLDDIASAAARAGRNNDARQASNMARTLRNEADALVPDYKLARDAFAGPAAVREAMEAGVELFGRRLHPADLRRMVDDMTTSEREALLQGARNAIEDKMGYAVNDALAIRNMFRSTFNQQKLEIVLGKDVADDLLRGLDREIVFGRTRNTVAHGSNTANKQVAQIEASPQTSNIHLSTGIFNAFGRAFNTARNKLHGGSQNRANEEMARLLTSNQIPKRALRAPQRFDLIDQTAMPMMNATARGVVLPDEQMRGFKRLGGR